MNTLYQKELKKRGIKPTSGNKYLKCPRCHSQNLGILNQTESGRTIKCDCGHQWVTKSKKLVR